MKHTTGSDEKDTPHDSWSQRSREAANRDDYRQAQDICQQAAAESEQAGRDRDASAAHHHAGMHAYRRGDLDEAEAAYRRSLAIDQQTGDEQGSAKTLNNLSAVAKERGDYDEAVDLLISSIRIKEKLRDERGVANSYHQLGIVANARGDSVAAELWYRRSLTASNALGDHYRKSISCIALYLLASSKKEHEESRQWLREAMQALDRLGNVNATINLGRDAQRRDSFDEALALYKKAVEIARQQDDEAKLSLALRYLCGIAEKMEGREAAIACLTEALAIEEKLGLHERIASGHRWLKRLKNPVYIAIEQGREAESRGAVDEALTCYRKAVELAQDQAEESSYARAYQYLGALAARTGDHNTARKCFEDAIEIDERAGDDKSLAYSRGWLEWLDDASSAGDIF